MKKNSFYVYEIQENATGKTVANTRVVNNAYNLVGLFTPAKGFTLISVNACDTLKEARKTADIWNEVARSKHNCLI